MRILFLFLLASALFAEEWREPDALYRLTVNHDVVGECGFLDFMKICLPVTLEKTEYFPMARRSSRTLRSDGFFFRNSSGVRSSCALFGNLRDKSD